MKRLAAVVACALLGTSGSVRAAPPEEAFVLHCSGCHGLDGNGHDEFIPSLRPLGSILSLPGGREYLARVPGVAQAPVSDAELARLLNWVLVEISGVDDFVRYDASEVGAWRKRPYRDPVLRRPRANER